MIFMCATCSHAQKILNFGILITFMKSDSLAGVYKKEKPKITCKEKSSVHHAPHSCDFEVDVCRKIDFHKPDIDKLCKKISRIDG